MVWSTDLPPAPVKPPVTGWFAVTVSNITVQLRAVAAALNGNLPMLGPMNVNLRPIVASLAGVQHPKGTISPVLKKVIFSGTGSHRQTGAMATQIKKLSASLVGVMVPSGTMSPVLKKVLVSFVAEQIYQGVVSATIKPVSVNLIGAQTQSGSLASNLQKLGATLAGTMVPSGTANATFKKVLVAFIGQQMQQGIINATLKPVSASVVALPIVEAQMAVTVKAVVAQINAVHAQSGSMAITLSKLSDSFAGFMRPSGTIAATLQKTSVSMAGSQAQIGTEVITLKKIEAALIGSQSQSGSVATTLSKTAAAFAATHGQSGVMASVLKALVADVVGDNQSINVVYDNATSVMTGFSNSAITTSLTVAANSTVLLFVLNHNNVPSNTPTIAGVAMTQHGTTIGRTKVFKAEGLSAGAKTISYTPGGLSYGAYLAVSFTGVTNIGTAVTVGPSNAPAGTNMSSGLISHSAGIILQCFTIYINNNNSVSMGSHSGGTLIANGNYSSGVAMSGSRASAATTFGAVSAGIGGNSNQYTSIAITLT